MIREIHILTGNQGKIREIRKWLVPIGIEVKTAEGDFIEAQVDSLEEVIMIGMEGFTAGKNIEIPIIKDDSGLFIEALDGFPGVYSAYVQRTLGNEGILRLMESQEDRNAVFKTVIGLYLPSRGTTLFTGICKGSISDNLRGGNGFGFDPIFIPEGENRTFAEMTIDDKNSMSHRIKAVKRLVSFLERNR
jgi:XTP/dITP diphosphohydrolase